VNGFSFLVKAKLCILWLIRCRYARMHDGTHPPLGVTETTHPSSSAASMEVVPD
jgi:hypothetical protein